MKTLLDGTDTDKGMQIKESLDHDHAFNLESLFTRPLRVAPTIGDQQAEIARLVYENNVGDRPALPRVGVRPEYPTHRRLRLLRQEYCPYCNARTYEVSYLAMQDGVEIKGACSCCGYRAQSMRGHSTKQY
jgi:hypothetical protein